MSGVAKSRASAFAAGILVFLLTLIVVAILGAPAWAALGFAIVAGLVMEAGNR